MPSTKSIFISQFMLEIYLKILPPCHIPLQPNILQIFFSDLFSLCSSNLLKYQRGMRNAFGLVLSEGKDPTYTSKRERVDNVIEG